MTLLGSASQLGRTLECPASQHLPHTRERTESMDAAANRGRAIHKYLEVVPELGTEAALELVPEEYREECRDIPWEKTAGRCTPPHRREVAMVHNGETLEVQELPVEERQYGELTPEQTPGTADVVVPGYATLEVWDYKTGRVPVEEPSQNKQLLHLALMAHRLMTPRASYVVLGVQTIRHLKRPKKVQIKSQRALIDRWDLDDFEQKLMAAQKQAKVAADAVSAGETPPVKTGPWCRFCDARPSCPVMGGK